jgi:hypothetical protein
MQERFVSTFIGDYSVGYPASQACVMTGIEDHRVIPVNEKDLAVLAIFRLDLLLCAVGNPILNEDPPEHVRVLGNAIAILPDKQHKNTGFFSLVTDK